MSVSAILPVVPPVDAKDYGKSKSPLTNHVCRPEENGIRVPDLNRISEEFQVSSKNSRNEKLCENGNLEDFVDQNYENSTSHMSQADEDDTIEIEKNETLACPDEFIISKRNSDSACCEKVASPEQTDAAPENSIPCTANYRNSVPQAAGIQIKSGQLEKGVSYSQSEDNIVHLRDGVNRGSRRSENYSRYVSGAFQFLKEMDNIPDVAGRKIDECEAMEEENKRLSNQGEELTAEMNGTGNKSDCETAEFSGHAKDAINDSMASASVEISGNIGENEAFICQLGEMNSNSVHEEAFIDKLHGEKISSNIAKGNTTVETDSLNKQTETVLHVRDLDMLEGDSQKVRKILSSGAEKVNGGQEKQEQSSAQGTDEGFSQEGDSTDVKTTESPVVRRRSTKGSVRSLKRQDSAEKYGRQESVEGETDSSDEDSGVYAESHRNSHWIRVEDDGSLTLPTLPYTISEEVDGDPGPSPDLSQKDDEVFDDNTTVFQKKHQRSDSNCTTASEKEFQNKFKYLRKCSVQRKDSQQAFYRMSTRYYENEQVITLAKDSGNKDFGLHILDSHPAIISAIIPGSVAEKAGLSAGQIVISVNGVNVLAANHEEIIKLVRQNLEMLTLELGQCDVFHSRDLNTPVMSGYLAKLGSSGLIKLWRKRWFVLRQDNCLYYYKSENDMDPLGAVPLSNYSVSKAVEMNRDYPFKLEKFGARTYFFAADSFESRKKWANAMTVAAQSPLKIESWMDVTSHNVGIPALSIRNPECSGYLGKLGQGRKAWRKRYCVLKDACIYYYKGIGSYSAQGVAHLHGYSIEGSASSSKRHSFLLRPPEPKMRVFEFATENDTDRERWMDSMGKSIARWKRLSTTEG